MQLQATFDPACLGPLSQLIGSWEGEKGQDISETNAVPVEKHYRESITFEPVGPIRNGKHELYGLRYTTQAWPDGEKTPFHTELGYWLWSPEDHQIVRCFTNQNGVTIHAGGSCDSDAHHLEMIASCESDEFGISSSPIMNNGCKTLSYKFKLDMLDDNQFSYVEETHLRSPAHEDVVIHTDKNALTRLF